MTTNNWNPRAPLGTIVRYKRDWRGSTVLSPIVRATATQFVLANGDRVGRASAKVIGYGHLADMPTPAEIDRVRADQNAHALRVRLRGVDWRIVPLADLRAIADLVSKAELVEATRQAAVQAKLEAAKSASDNG